jgi:alkane 1-monooxygenase
MPYAHECTKYFGEDHGLEAFGLGVPNALHRHRRKNTACIIYFLVNYGCMAEKKKIGYFLFLLPAVALLAAVGIGKLTGRWDAATLFPPFFIFVLVPLLDLVIGKDSENPENEAELRADRFYTVLLVLCLPVQLAILGLGAWLFVHGPFSTLGRIGWAVGVGISSGSLAINTGHELIHRQNKWLRWTGGALLGTVGYASFMVEHVLGHHVHVATPEDGSTARRGENVYAFIGRAFVRNIAHAFRLEAAQRKRRNKRLIQSELLWAYLGTVALVGLFGLVLGPTAMLFIVIQGCVAIALLEIVNFVEHYGLQRTRLPSGRGYENTNPMHSWNSNYLLTNLLLFQLQRHSDHHANAARPYQVLRHMPASAQLPYGYATMVILALVPPLYRAVMHPILDQHAEQVDTGVAAERVAS